MNEKELQQSLATLELYRAQLQSLAEQQQLIQMSLEENARAKETLSNFKSAPIDSEILVPVGGNSFVFAKIGSNSKAIVSVGSRVSLEKPIEDAMKMIETRINELVETFTKLGERRSAIEAQSSQLSQQLQQEYQRIQSQ
ncbi:MAG: prefoldin subunit alpha [Methanomassiliicoccales archaeon]|nr:prefoldin subunit alpha [Methanomassiliicoccales archaeon]